MRNKYVIIATIILVAFVTILELYEINKLKKKI